MAPGAAIVTDRLLYPCTRARLEGDRSFQAGFLVLVSVLAFIVFSVGNRLYDRIETHIARFSAIWWHVFPYACGTLVIADRLFNAFGSKGRVKLFPETPPRSPAASEPERDNLAPFDPKRFL